MPTTEKFNVLRVTQLDAEEINNGIYNILRNEIKDSLQTAPFTYLLNFEPEISAFLRFVLWKYSINDTGSSIGQAMLNAKYTLKNGEKLTTAKKYAYCVLTVLFYWLRDRQTQILNVIGIILEKKKKSQLLPIFERLLSYCTTALNFLSLLNFFNFLCSGQNVNLIDWLLGLNHVFRTKPAPRYIDYEYMRKELLWKYIRDTTICILPFINFRRVSNLFQSLWQSHSTQDEDHNMNLLTCGICSEKATNPYSCQCNHIFCYYCIHGNLNADSNYCCTICGEMVTHIEPVMFRRVCGD